MNISIWRIGLLIVPLVVMGAVASMAMDAPAPLAAQTAGIDLTVYNSDIALVRESREFDLEKGINVVQVTDVPSGIIPETVYFRSLTDPNASVLEQNYEYDIVGSQKLLEKYVDQPIQIMTKDGMVYEGTLLSGAQDVILQDEEGGVVVVKFDQIQQYSFPALPESLITKPTLVWMVDAGKEGKHEAEIAYLTNGLNWEANYVLVLAQDDKSMDLTGWVTLDNRSGATYEDARLKLVAGDIGRVTQPEVLLKFAPAMAVGGGGPPQVEQREFFEYHLYEVQRPVTIKNNQKKQIEFVSASEVPAKKTFVYEGSPRYIPFYGPIYDPGYGVTGNKKVDVVLTFNTGEEGVNAQLPKGVIRMYQADVDGAPLLIGEDEIDHTPKGEDVNLTIGQAFDLVGERTQTDFNRIGEKVIEESYRIELRNRKESEDVSIRVIEHMFRGTDWEITETSHPDYKKVDSNTVEWTVEVPAKDSVTITYTVRYSY